MTARIFRLTQIHQRIDDRLRDQLKSRAPDNMAITQLKKMKLRVKDLLYQLAPRPTSN